jgi:hypothetical protein
MTSYCGRCNRIQEGEFMHPCKVCSPYVKFFFEEDDFIRANQCGKRLYDISELELLMINQALEVFANHTPLEKDRCWLISIANELRSQRIRKMLGTA